MYGINFRLFAIFIFYITGIIAGRHLFELPFFVPISVVFVLFPVLKFKKLFFIFGCAAFLILGIFSIQNAEKQDVTAQEVPKNPTIYKAILLGYPSFAKNHYVYSLKLFKTFSNNTTFLIDASATVYSRYYLYVGVGDIILLNLNLKKSYNNYIAYFDDPNGVILISNKAGFLKKYIAKLRKELFDNLKDKDIYGINMATLLGFSKILDPDFKNASIKTQTIHLFVISGTHIGMIYLFLIYFIKSIMSFFPSIMLKFYWKKVGAIFAIIILLFYLLLIGFQVSAVRSFLMFSVFSLSFFLSRKTSLLNLIFIAALILLFLDPNALFDISFQLSFLSVVAIAVIAIPIISKTNKVIKNPIATNVLNSLIITLSISFLLAPIIIFYFKSFSISSPIINLISIPIASFILIPSLFCYLIFFFASPTLANFFFKIPFFFSEIIRNLIFLFYNSPINVEIKPSIKTVAICYSVFLFFLVILKIRRNYKR